MNEPRIPGFTVESHLGGGGFADVYLCWEHDLRRRVAVKVPRAGSAGAQQAFELEANAMAQLVHPHIAVIHRATRTEDGRPALVMAYYPGRDMGGRYRQERMALDEVLRIGIQVASAVQAAHQAGILHRDIKPANILTEAYGRPALSDFGIASFRDRSAVVDALSLPWSAPEAVRGTGFDERSDIYALAATLYAMLSGRSPFEVGGGPNDEDSLRTRICQAEPDRTGRPDVPANLERILSRALSRRPDDRPQTALEFARQLQSVERGLQLVVTEVDIAPPASGGPPPPIATPSTEPPTPPVGGAAAPKAATVVRAGSAVAVSGSEAAPESERGLADTGLRAVRPDHQVRAAEEVQLAPGAVPAGSGGHPLARPGSAGRDRRGLWLAAAGLVVAAVAVAAWVLVPDGGAPDVGPSGPAAPTEVVDPNAVTDLAPPTGLTVRRVGSGTVAAEWEQPQDWQAGDWYVWRVTGAGEPTSSARVTAPGARLSGVNQDAQPCFHVAHRRDGAESPFVTTCLPAQ